MCVCVCVSLQAVNGELVPFLLKLLEDPLIEVDKPSATKALIAEALKSMAKDLANGEIVQTLACVFYTVFYQYTSTFEQINELLDASPVWSAYKDQKHDLFLTETTISGYLTGPTGVAGYLTAGTSSMGGASNVPPPLQEPPDDENTGKPN